MNLKTRFFCSALAALLAGSANAAITPTNTVKVSGCEIAFTPGVGALNTLKSQLNTATNSVDVAMFRLSNRWLVDALCVLARDRQVTVRVLLDADEIATPADGEAYDYLRQRLVRNGVQVLVYAANDNHGRMQKMHLRCAVIDGKTVMTGSCNWRAESFEGKCDDLVVLHSPALAAIYTAEINQLATSATPLAPASPAPTQPDVITFPALETAADGSIPGAFAVTNAFRVTVYFSPDASGFDAMVGQIVSATNQVDMAMRYLGYLKVNNAVLQAASNGVPVRLAVDKDMYRKRFASFRNVLTQPGVTTYASQPKQPGLHLKVTAIDNRWLWTGSANATVWADTLDVEDMLQIDSPAVTAAYGQMFARLTDWFEKNPQDRHRNAMERNSDSGMPSAKPAKIGKDQNVAQP